MNGPVGFTQYNHPTQLHLDRPQHSSDNLTLTLHPTSPAPTTTPATSEATTTLEATIPPEGLTTMEAATTTTSRASWEGD